MILVFWVARVAKMAVPGRPAEGIARRLLRLGQLTVMVYVSLGDPLVYPSRSTWPPPGAPPGQDGRIDLGLRDRLYLITGGSRGLGFAAAQALVSKGARVLISAPTSPQSAAAAPRITRSPRPVYRMAVPAPPSPIPRASRSPPPGTALAVWTDADQRRRIARRKVADSPGRRVAVRVREGLPGRGTASSSTRHRCSRPPPRSCCDQIAPGPAAPSLSSWLHRTRAATRPRHLQRALPRTRRRG